MGKSKKIKKGAADSVYAKKSTAIQKSNPFNNSSTTTKPINPFEVHVNKEKFKILGRTCKHDKGLPGVSRGRALEKRKRTLGKEYQNQYKSNKFQDKRIGRHLSGAQLTDEVLNARFLAEKLSQIRSSKASRFNLNDDEILTHRGQTLEDIENFRDNRSDDESEDENLDASFTEAAHFGGTETDNKDRQTAIDDMISDQKRRKLEIAKERDEVFEITEKLDRNYKDLLSVMGSLTKPDEKPKKVIDDYDKALREMVFEPRGGVAEKTLTDEEKARRDREELEKLENERRKRMLSNGDDTEQNMPFTHRSADDLDDGYYGYSVAEEPGTLAYGLDGKLVSKVNMKNDENAEYQNGDDDGLENGDDDEKDEDAEEETDNEEGNDENDEESDDDEEEESSEEDNLSDLKVTDSETEEIEHPNTVTKKRKKLEIESNEVPFTPEVPETYDIFQLSISQFSPENQGLLLERTIKFCHPKLDIKNREEVLRLFAFSLQYVNEIFSEVTKDDVAVSFRIIDRLNPHLYELMQLDASQMSITLQNVIKQKYSEYRRNQRFYPSLETLVFLKLVSNFCSTSDYRHPLVTPCYIFLQHVLSKARINNRRDIARGLFLVTLSLEYCQQSKRFVPAALNFLLGVLFMCIPKKTIEVFKILPPFQNTEPSSTLLVASNSECIDFETEELMSSEDLVTIDMTSDFKLRCLNTTLKLIDDAMTTFSELVGCQYLADPLLDMLHRLTLDEYPAFVQKNYNSVKEKLESIMKQSLTKLTPPQKKPKALRLLEPRIEKIYDDKRRPKLSKEKEERVKLLHKLKRETKGAVREIRRDTQFLQNIRLKKQIASDIERKEKVKRIYQEASIQQGELNALGRTKKKNKF